LRGRAEGQARGSSKAAPVLTEQVVWYAPEVKRIVKQTISTHVGNTQREASSFELTEVKLN